MGIIDTVQRLNRKGYGIEDDAGSILLIGYILEAIANGSVDPDLEASAKGKVYIGSHSFSLGEYLEALKTCKHSKNPSSLLVKRLTGRKGQVHFYRSEVLGIIGVAVHPD